MKLTFDVQDLPQLQEALREMSQRRLNAGVATGLTRTAVQVRDAQRAAMTQVFDRPTPYTLNSLWLQPATGSMSAAGRVELPALPGKNAFFGRRGQAGYLEAQVYIKDQGNNQGAAIDHYLRPQIESGTRDAKGLEKTLYRAGVLPAGWRVVPGQSARLDAYGNVSRGQITEVLSQLRIQIVAGSSRSMSFEPKAMRRAVKRAGGRYFLVPLNRGYKLPPGIYQREYFVRAIGCIFLFVRKATYRQRFDFFGIAQRVAAANLKANVSAAVAEQLQRLEAQAKGAAR